MSWKAISHVLMINQIAAVTITYNKDNNDNSGETNALLEYAMCLAVYAALTAIFIMVIALVVKLLWNFDGDEDEAEGSAEGQRAATENSRLLLSKNEVFKMYGTNDKDLESGSTSSSDQDDDLYDGKICVICYDDQRDCFFFPCGHCVTCHTCARRILKDENRTCPICRTFIDKVKRLHIV